MATYKDLVGTAIRNNEGNIPTAETGQVFFDSTNIDFKYQFPVTLSSWRTSNNFNSPASSGRGDGAQGTQDAALAAGYFRDTGGTPEYFNGCETYNGITWTEVNDLNTTRTASGKFGLNPATIVSGGYNGTAPQAVCEYYNGTSWTEVNDLNTARNSHGATGAYPSAIVFGAVSAP